MNTRTIVLYKDDEEIVVDVQRVEEFAALGYVATASEGPENKLDENPEDKPEGDDGKPAGKVRGKGGK